MRRRQRHRHVEVRAPSSCGAEDRQVEPRVDGVQDRVGALERDQLGDRPTSATRRARRPRSESRPRGRRRPARGRARRRRTSSARRTRRLATAATAAPTPPEPMTSTRTAADTTDGVRPRTRKRLPAPPAVRPRRRHRLTHMNARRPRPLRTRRLGCLSWTRSGCETRGAAFDAKAGLSLAPSQRSPWSGQPGECVVLRLRRRLRAARAGAIRSPPRPGVVTDEASHPAAYNACSSVGTGELLSGRALAPRLPRRRV